jgi:hypothetical protein
LALGTAVVALTHTLIAFTGGLAGLAIAGLAGLAIPYRRKVAKRELHERIETLVVQVRKDIQAKAIEFAGQTQREVREAIEPCVKLVTSERDRCSENCANLRKVSQAMAKLRDRIGKVMPEKVWQPN